MVAWLQNSNPPQESVSTQRTAKAVAAESRTDGWLLLDEGELQQRRNVFERNARWHVMQLPCPSPSSAPVTHLINTPPNASVASSMATTTTTVTTRKMDPNLIKTHDLSFFISPLQRENSVIYLSSSSSTSEDDNCVDESQTLQLFPLRSTGDGSSDNMMKDNETEISTSAMNNANNLTTPGQFFEFLPMKE